MSEQYLEIWDFDQTHLHVTQQTHGLRESINIYYGPGMRGVSFVTPPALTHYPRTSGDGDFVPGAQFGPATEDKARFTIDLCDEPVDGGLDNSDFAKFIAIVDSVDAALLEYVFNHQPKILGRKNLSKDEVKMLQIPSIRRGIDKLTGADRPPHFVPKMRKYYYDQVKNKRENHVTVCDHGGRVLEGGQVMPDDVVSATVHLAGVYTGVGGDKFGINWSFKEIQVVCQAVHKRQKTEVSAFSNRGFDFAHDYSSESMV
jgi:hypothetical protein